MKDESTAHFLAQFNASKKNVAGWPDWMRNAAKVATASFPESKVDVKKSQVVVSVKGKK